MSILEAEFEEVPERKVLEKYHGYNFYFGRFPCFVVEFREIEAQILEFSLNNNRFRLSNREKGSAELCHAAPCR